VTKITKVPLEKKETSKTWLDKLCGVRDREFPNTSKLRKEKKKET
jgi:hypothetical protein